LQNFLNAPRNIVEENYTILSVIQMF